MSTAASPAFAALVWDAAAHTSTARRRPESARGLAGVLLAAAVAALVLLVDRLLGAWVDGHWLLGWVALWGVIFVGSALLAGSARRLARRTVAALDGWSRSLAEARAEARLWELANRDPRLKAELIESRARASQAHAEPVVCPHDFSPALAPLGLEPGQAWVTPLPRTQTEAHSHARYLPYI